MRNVIVTIMARGPAMIIRPTNAALPGATDFEFCEVPERGIAKICVYIAILVAEERGCGVPATA
jgi:hypothetical protein